MTTAPIIRKPVPRKPPAKRLFSGMAGSPLAQITEPIPEPAQTPPVAVEPPSVSKQKPGPKPKYGTAMTSAERQRQSRADRKQEQQDTERRKLIAELMRIYRRQQNDVIHQCIYDLLGNRSRTTFFTAFISLQVGHLRRNFFSAGQL